MFTSDCIADQYSAHSEFFFALTHWLTGCFTSYWNLTFHKAFFWNVFGSKVGDVVWQYFERKLWSSAAWTLRAPLFCALFATSFARVKKLLPTRNQCLNADFGSSHQELSNLDDNDLALIISKSPSATVTLQEKLQCSVPCFSWSSMGIP